MYTFPDNSNLNKHLASLMPEKEIPIEIISRTSFKETSTFPVEIIECKTATGKTENLFCKYLAGMGPNNFGHRGGVDYEAQVYQQILKSAPFPTVKFFGRCELDSKGESMFVIDFLGPALRIKYTGDPYVTNYAAEWLGKFHHHFAGKKYEFLTIYDRKYYLQWPEKFRTLTKKYNDRIKWFSAIADFFESNIDKLCDDTQTIIHGEYYPKNILIKDGIIFPIDWESAAFGAGEIDVASITEGWDEEFTANVIKHYVANRWPDGNYSVADFNMRLLLARIYFHFWWWHEEDDAQNFEKSEGVISLKELAVKAGVMR
jgi:hypothetical protein